MINAAQYYYTEEDNLPSSYIDIDDLKKVLEAYFAKELDNCTPYIDRLYLEPHELNPNNSLWGQLDSDTIKRLLKSLPRVYQTVINYRYDQSPELNRSLLYSFYSIEQTEDSYDNWESMKFIEALDYLSQLILEIL